MLVLIDTIRIFLQKKGLIDIGKPALCVLILQCVIQGLNLGTSVFVARNVSLEIKGQMDLFSFFLDSILQFCMLGFTNGVLYYQTKEKVSLSKIQGNAIIFVAIVSLVIVSLGLSCIDFLGAFFDGIDRFYLKLGLFCVPFLLYTQIFQNILIGLNKAVYGYVISVLLGMITFLFLILLYVCDSFSFASLVYLRCATDFMFFCVALIWGEKKCGVPQIDIPLLVKMLKYGIVVYIGFIANLLLFKMDILFLNKLNGSEAVGIYTVSVRFAEMLFFFDTAITATTIYKITHTDLVSAQNVTIQIVKVKAKLLVIAGIVLVLGAYPIVAILYGNSYIEAVIPLVILIPAIIAWSLVKSLSEFVSFCLGKPKYCSIAAICGVIANFVLNMMLIPKNGIIGAALASLCSYLFVAVYMGYIFYTRTKRKEKVDDTDKGADCCAAK